MKFTATSSGEVGPNEFRIRKPECSILQQSIYLKAFSVHMATYTHPGLWGWVGVCVVVCMILSSNISGMAFIHSVSVQENFQVTNSLRMDPNRTEDRTFKRNYYIIIWVEFGETLHFDPVLKTGNRLGDVHNGYHSHCAPIIQLSLLLFRWKRKRINHVESVKPCPCRSSLSLLVVVVRFLGQPVRIL